MSKRGLFKKYAVSRYDGQDYPNKKHHGCTYFVIDLRHDTIYGRAAILTYAAVCETDEPELAAHLRLVAFEQSHGGDGASTAHDLMRESNESPTLPRP